MSKILNFCCNTCWYTEWCLEDFVCIHSEGHATKKEDEDTVGKLTKLSSKSFREKWKAKFPNCDWYLKLCWGIVCPKKNYHLLVKTQEI
jgi:hypothetical protein